MRSDTARDSSGRASSSHRWRVRECQIVHHGTVWVTFATGTRLTLWDVPMMPLQAFRLFTSITRCADRNVACLSITGH